jgi:hypothetical protein
MLKCQPIDRKIAHLQSASGGVMQEPLRTHKIIQQVVKRLLWVEVGRQFYFWLLVTSALYGVVLAANRLLGLNWSWGREWLQSFVSVPIAPVTLLVVPLTAAVISLIWHRNPTLADAARRMDQYGKTKDLFLTYSLLDRSAGGYQSLVAQVAEEQAPSVVPKRVIPFCWTQRSTHLAALGLVLLLSAFYLPQLDPLGRVAEAARVEEDKQQQLDDSRATVLRLEKVHKRQQDEAVVSQVEQAIKEMTESIRDMKPAVPAANHKQLSEHQRRLGKKWRQWRAEKLGKLLSAADSLQDFGGKRSKKFQQWQKELKAGDDTSLRKELARLSDDLKAITAEKDPIKRGEMLRKLKQQLRDVEQFASEKAGSPELAAAMQRALRQLEAAQKDDTFSEMMDDMNKTLNLAQLELKQLSKAAAELEKLEQSLKVLQMAKQINSDGQLDGAVCSECQSLADYAEVFQELMGSDEGSGDGMGNRGFGEGGEAPEDDSVATDYKTERSRSAVKAGKVLLSMQAKGISDAGDVEHSYQELVAQVKQGVNEAILQEQVPPGYHDAIRNYFDTVRETRAVKTPASDAPDDDGS